MFGKLANHKKKVAIALALLGALAAYLTGECNAACVATTLGAAVGL